MTKSTVNARSHTLQETNTKDSTEITRKMALGSSSLQMVQFIKEISMTIYSKDEGKSFTRIKTLTKASSIKVLNTVKVHINIPTETFTKEIGKKARKTDTVSSLTVNKATNTQEIGR